MARLPGNTTDTSRHSPIGDAQRARLQARTSALRWWTAVGGVAGAIAFSVLAARATAAAPAVTLGAPSGTAPKQTEPSQSLFQEQGDSEGKGGFLAPAPSGSFGRSRVRSATS